MWEKIQAVLSVLGLLCGFVLILALAYWATKLLGRRYGLPQGGNDTVKVLGRTILAQDRQLCIVQVAGRTLLLGVAPQSISLLCELDGEQLPPPAQTPAAEPFAEVFRSVLHRGETKPKGEARDE